MLLTFSERLNDPILTYGFTIGGETVMLVAVGDYLEIEQGVN